MATISQILSFGRRRGGPWDGCGYASCQGLPNLADAYATLSGWTGPVAKPTLAEVQALNAAADAWLIDEARKARQQDAIARNDNEKDALVRAFSVVADALVEIATKAQLRGGQTWDPVLVNRVQALRTQIEAIKALA